MTLKKLERQPAQHIHQCVDQELGVFLQQRGHQDKTENPSLAVINQQQFPIVSIYTRYSKHCWVGGEVTASISLNQRRL